jgi:hypothetical protein
VASIFSSPPLSFSLPSVITTFPPFSFSPRPQNALKTVLKTHMASHRSDSLTTAVKKTYAKGGFKGFYAGLVPWVRPFLPPFFPFILADSPDLYLRPQAWIESSTTGGILLFTSSAVESFAMGKGVSPGSAGLLGGVIGGAAQAYLAMGAFFSLCPPLFFLEKLSTSKVVDEFTDVTRPHRRLHLHENGRNHPRQISPPLSHPR